ncbi:lipid-A-disaccharide synthase [Coxiella endosymbiont of Amblyomma nuttalli]|uniref:lipid-A-disaccharide synthase n=1 Tax=Coxiella endosymbiont of Amblyomma nuttalli TaxID=2749996 RepID=UPI001BADF077|nr:lipid-A-disaccharide synthase [Coxiella endosymbiont of Amblyomma nuttalli]QTS83715.1 Lipid-A-disaccharide synthase [Coxiella endosymbiont of Amblyomma nuttalli]
MTKFSKQILIISGEASGDLLGAHLAKSLKTLDPTILLTGVGGKQMRDAGVSIFIDSNRLGVVGLFEAFKYLNIILSIRQTLKKRFKKTPPNLVVFIDYPGFNLHMAKHAKKAGIPVLYYVSPQTWAWRYGRTKNIKKYVDQMAVLFAFEEKLYQRENIPVNLVGHPLIDIAVPSLCRKEAYQRFNLSPDKPIIGLFPGSRNNEITRLLPIIVSAAHLIQKHIPQVQFVLPLAPNLSMDDIRNYLFPEIKVIKHNVYNILPLCDAAIATSGTVTLEIALYQVPFIIIYKVALLTYWLVKNLIRVPCIGLSNLVAGARVTPELIQKAATPEAIANEICRLLEDSFYRQYRLTQLKPIKEKLGGGGASMRVARLALEMLYLSTTAEQSLCKKAKMSS